MGVVYAVHDGVRHDAVALKTLLRARPADVSRLKREFRSLADIAHPNVVCLHELVVEPDHCFFTMELVDGLGVSEYVRAPVADAAPVWTATRRSRPGAERPAAARGGSVGAARQGQAPSGHQALQHHGQARRTRGHP